MAIKLTYEPRIDIVQDGSQISAFRSSVYHGVMRNGIDGDRYIEEFPSGEIRVFSNLKYGCERLDDLVVGIGYREESEQNRTSHPYDLIYRRTSDPSPTRYEISDLAYYYIHNEVRLLACALFPSENFAKSPRTDLFVLSNRDLSNIAANEPIVVEDDTPGQCPLSILPREHVIKIYFHILASIHNGFTEIDYAQRDSNPLHAFHGAIINYVKPLNGGLFREYYGDPKK